MSEFTMQKKNEEKGLTDTQFEFQNMREYRANTVLDRKQLHNSKFKNIFIKK